jgi:hypothetical protein
VIARFFILLPLDLFIIEEDQWSTVEAKVEGGAAGEFSFRVFPPTLNAERPKPTDTVLSQGIGRMGPPSFTDNLLVNGKRVAPVNILTVDIIKREFDRSVDAPLDPTPDLAFEIANDVLSRLRAYSSAFDIESLSLTRDPWQLRYLTDELKELESEDGKRRGSVNFSITIGGAAITPEIFNLVRDNWHRAEPYVWDQLLLDARSQFPDVGASIVMAVAALENFIAYALDVLHQEQPLPHGLWDWINDRGDWTKEPSVYEQFDVLLTLFTHRSLKTEEPSLWESFIHLKKARNALAHEGVPVVGKNAELVDPEKAKKFVNDADKIVEWIEGLLPERYRRLRIAATGPFARRMASEQEAAVFGVARVSKGQLGALAPGQSIRLGFEPKPGEPPGSKSDIDDSVVGAQNPKHD